MPVVAKSSSFVYVSPPPQVLYEGYKKLQETAKRFVEEKMSKKVIGDDKLLGDILVRVDQRKEYYKIYHNGTELWELRESALIAYWILKYRPFKIPGVDYSRVNERIALHFLESVAFAIHKHKKQASPPFSDAFRNRVLHSFAEHDVSKEQLMLLAEAMYEGQPIE
jgi:hypothetical protein